MPKPHTGEWSGIRQFGQLAADPGGQDNGARGALDATYFGLANPSA
jgi:hypothetical protein